jgi:DNA repair ATPase RecN
MTIETDGAGRLILARVRQHLGSLEEAIAETPEGSRRTALKAARDALQAHHESQQAYIAVRGALVSLVDAVRSVRHVSTCLTRDPRAIAEAESELDEAIRRAGILRDDIEDGPDNERGKR